MTRHAAIILVSAAMLLAPLGVRADSVELVNGDRLSGKLLRLSTDTLEFETAYAGTLKIPRSAVATLQTDGDVRVIVAGDPQLRSARLAGAGAGRVRVDAPGPGAARTLALERLAHVNPPPEVSGVGVSYRGRVTASAAQVRGNASSSRAYGETELHARAKAYRYALGFKGTRAKDDGTRRESNWIANGNYDRFLDARRFYYGRASLERDRFRGIDLRASAGAGYGLLLYDTERTQLSVRGGLDAVSLRRTGGARDRHPAAGWGVRFTHWLWQRRAQLFHDQDGFWNLDNTREATLRSRSGLRVPIAAGLTASAQLNLDWEKEPAPGRKATDSTLLFGVGYEW